MCLQISHSSDLEFKRGNHGDVNLPFSTTSITCNLASFPSHPGIYACPGGEGVYEVESVAGGTCVFDTICEKDPLHEQLCGCPLINLWSQVNKWRNRVLEWSVSNAEHMLDTRPPLGPPVKRERTWTHVRSLSHNFSQTSSLYIESTVCRDKNGYVIGIWSENYCDGLVSILCFQGPFPTLILLQNRYPIEKRAYSIGLSQYCSRSL